MRRWLLAVLLVSAVSLALPSGAGAQTPQPTIVFEENCYKSPDNGAQVYGVRWGVTGFPPNAGYSWSLTFQDINPDGSIGPIHSRIGPSTFPTSFIFFVGSFVPTLYTLTVESPDGSTVVKTLRVTCEPTSVEQCKNSGYLAFDFRNQGQCVAFVRRGAKP
jgi:hypothetical protein